MRGKDPLRLARDTVLPGDVDARPLGPPICWACGSRGATTRDHLIPVSIDWTDLDIPSHPGHSPANVAWAHWSCNVDRSNTVTPDALALFNSRRETLPVTWYDGTYDDFLLEVAHELARTANRPPFLYYGGPLDGKAPRSTRSIYQDATGAKLSTSRGDGYMHGRTRTPEHGIYSRQNDGYLWRLLSDPDSMSRYTV
jgi:hypothetical protein